MRTRLVRTRRKTGSATAWVMVFLLVALGTYIKVSLPVLQRMRAEEAAVSGPGERTTKTVEIGPLEAHLVSFGGYHTEAEAQVEAARYVPRGAAGYILDGEMLMVIGAAYGEKEQAEKVCAQLSASEGMSCTVVSLETEGVRMRMTAGSEQITAFLTGEAALREAAGGLGRLSFSIDRREATAQQAAEVIATHEKKVSGALETLSELTEGTQSEFFLSLEGMLEEMVAQMKEMQKETGAMALSSRLKYFAVDFLVREIEWLNGLGGK